MITGRIILNIENLNKFNQRNSLKKSCQSLRTNFQFSPIIAEPSLIDNRNVTMLNHVLVARLPIRLEARLTFKSRARNKAAIGPVPGMIPQKIPTPTPAATLWGESFILKSF